MEEMVSMATVAMPMATGKRPKSILERFTSLSPWLKMD